MMDKVERNNNEDGVPGIIHKNLNQNRAIPNLEYLRLNGGCHNASAGAIVLR